MTSVFTSKKILLAGIKDKCPVQGEFIKNGKHYLRIITHDIVRDIIIPSEQPNVNTAVFTKEDMQKIYEKPEVLNTIFFLIY